VGARLRRDVRREQILDAAREVFERAGYHDAKVADIARRIGVVEGTIYACFATKRELISALIARWYAEIGKRMREGLAGIAGTRNRLRFFAWRHAQTLVEEADICAVILQESRHAEAEMATGIRALNRAYTAPLRQILQDGQRAGELDPELSVGLVVNTVLGTIEHEFWQRRAAGGSRLDASRLADALCASLWSGIAVRERAAAADQRLDAILARIEASLPAATTSPETHACSARS